VPEPLTRFLLAISCLGLASAPGAALAGVIRVPTDAFALATAVDLAAPGDTIRVVGNGGATYLGNQEIDKDLVLEGGWRGDFQIRDPDIYVSVLRDPNGGFLHPIIRVFGSARVIVDGFQIRGGRFGLYADEGADVVVRNCQFREQRNGSLQTPLPGRPGGAVGMRGGTLLLENVTIEGMVTGFHGAGLGLQDMQQVVIRDSRIAGCNNIPILFGILTPAFGGGMYVTDVGELRLERTEIAGCGSFSRGGLGFVTGTTVVATDCNFEFGNGGTTGGAFVLEECPSASFVNCRFSTNRSLQGAALWVRACVGGLRIEASEFVSNSPSPNPTDPEGGALWIESTPLEIRDSTFQSNHGVGASDWIRGGAVRAEDSDCIVTNSRFIGERAIGHGGAWSQIGGRTLFDGCTFRDNESNLRGGALHIELAGTLEVRNSLFEGNRGTLGGGIAASFTAGVDVDHCTFVRNQAGSAGGAIYLDTGAAGRVENSILCCAPRGDLVYCSSAELVMRTSDLWNDDRVNVRDELGGSCPDVIAQYGNIQENPEFCDPSGPGFEISENSPCAGAASDETDMGWASTGCPGAAPVSIRAESFGSIKGRYRPR